MKKTYPFQRQSMIHLLKKSSMILLSKLAGSFLENFIIISKQLTFWSLSAAKLLEKTFLKSIVRW